MLDSARDHAVPLRSEDFSEAVRNFSGTMFNVLVQVVKAKALGIVKTGPPVRARTGTGPAALWVLLEPASL